MEYPLIIIFQLLGVLFRCGKTVAELKKSHPEKTRKEIINILSVEDWNTVVMSLVVMGFDLALHWSIHVAGISFDHGDFQIWGMVITHYAIYIFGTVALASILGYKGQELIYKWLGSAADRLDKEVSEKITK